MKNNRKVCVCLPHGGSAAVEYSPMWAGSMGGESHCGKSSVAIKFELVLSMRIAMRVVILLICGAMSVFAHAEEVVQKEAQNMDTNKPTGNVIGEVRHPQKLFLADKLSYLTMHIRSMHGTVPVTGTGFFFSFRIKDKRGLRVPALVTNKHVVLGFTGTTLTFTVAEDGFPSDKTVQFRTGRGTNLWYPHPDSDVDLCALPIQPIIEHYRRQGVELFIVPADYSLVADDAFLQNVTQLDDVAMIGYPDGVWDAVNNQPIFRKGVIATRPSKSYNGKREFIIDMPVYGGSSGSPILIASDGPWKDRSNNALRTAAPTKLVGVVYKTFIHNDLGKLISVPIPTLATDENNAAIVRVPNNLGLVISASRLLEMEAMFTDMLGIKE